MTVVVAALTKSHGVVMAADSQTTIGLEKAYHDQAKLWVTGDWVCGAAGSQRVQQVLQHCMDWPKFRPDEHDWEKFLVTSLVPEIRQAAEAGGVMADYENIKMLWQYSAVLVATGDKLATIYADGSVFCNGAGRHAIGCGTSHAMGSLVGQGPWRRSDVIRAARSAVESTVGVGGPISVASTKTLQIGTATW